MKKKLTRSILLFLLFFLTAINYKVKAQIVYTDISDIHLKCSGDVCSKGYRLDLNNDGTTDFVIHAKASRQYPLDPNYGPHCTKCPLYTNTVSVSPPGTGNGSSVAADNFTAFAPAFNSGDLINLSLVWFASAKLKGVYSSCSGFPTLPGQCISGSEGHWTMSSDRYLGLKLISNNQTYYGWARLSVSVNSNIASFKIKDYAYQSTPDVSIIAGDTGESPVTKISNENAMEDVFDSNELKIAPNPASASATVSFSLSRPGKISINIYSITGQIVNRLVDKMYNEGQSSTKA